MKKISLVMSACLMGMMAQAQLIDDFGVAGLGEYTQTRVLDNGIAEANVSFSDVSGKLTAAYAGTVNQAEQVVLLRNDFSLAIGYRLLVDVSFLSQSSQMDFGIAVSSIATPTSASIADTDTRDTFNWAAIYVRPSQNAVRASSFINAVAVTGVGVLGVDETLVGRLFIDRDSATSFTLGYYDTSALRVVSRTAVFTATDVGTAIGLYGDLRAAGGTLGDLDNFRIVPIPEPSAAALAGIGMLAVFGRMRRRA